MADNVTCMFMRLPRELRNLIYHEVWQNTAISITSEQAIFRLYYDTELQFPYNGPVRDPLGGLPQWLLCSNTILNEGIQQLKSRATWVTLLRKGCSIRSPLIGLPVATNVTIKGFLHRDPTVSDSFTLVSTRVTPTAAPFHTLLGPNLKSLNLNLVTVCFNGRYGRVDPVAFYKIVLPHFNNVQVDLDSLRLRFVAPVRSRSNALMHSLQAACEDEVTRVGVLTVGRDAKVESTVHFHEGDGRSTSLPWRLEINVRYYKPNARCVDWGK